MKKIFNYTFLALLSVITFGVSSCTSDYDYDPVAPEQSMQVYFPELSKSIELSEGQNVIPVEILRIDSTEAVSIPVVLTDPSGIFSIQGGNNVAFAAGAKAAKANIVFDFNKIQADTPYEVKVSLADSSVQTVYGAASTSVSLKYSPWSQWAPWAQGKGDYTYTQYWSGVDKGLQIYYRESLIPGSTQAQFRIDNWGGGISLYIDYDKGTGECYIPEQFTGVHSSNYDEDIMVADIPTWQGNEELRPDYGSYYDAEAGKFYLQLAYYISLGSFGYGLETFQCDGFYQPDYNLYMSYVGAYKDIKDNTGAIVNFTKGVDVASYKYIVLEGAYSADYTEAIGAQVSADPDKFGAISSTEDGTKFIQLEADGAYTIASINYDENDEYVGCNLYTFKYESAGGAKWQSIGLCKYTDDCVGPLFEADPITYDVEVMVNSEKPGIYRLINPYGAAFPYNEEGDWDASQDWNIEINAADPDGVYIEEQATGCDWGYGNMAIMSMGYYFMAYKDASFDEVKEEGLMGTLKDGVITFPVKGLAVANDDDMYYANQNGAFSLDLNGASKAKARKATAHKNIAKGEKTGKADFSKPLIRKALNVRVYRISAEKARKNVSLRNF